MNLRERVLHSLKWLAAGRIVGQAVAWFITLFVIRILEPTDYGLMAVANILIGFAMLFRQLGLYTAMVQNAELTDRQVEQSFGMLLLVNGGIYALITATAPFIASFFDDPRLTDIIRILGLQFPLAAIGVVQGAMLSRRMAFKRTSIVGLAALLSNAFMTLTLALAGFGVWALVWGSLTGSLCRSVGLVIAAWHWCRPRFWFTDIAEMLRFGSFVTTSRLLWYGYQQSDKLIIGKLLGNSTLGQYSVAMQLASMPLQKFSSLMNQVGLAAYSTVQTDPGAIRFYYLKAIRSVAFFAFPVFWGISSISAPLVNVVLGDGWQPAIFPLAVLSLIMPTRMISSAGSAAYEAVGKPQVSTVNILITFLVMPPAFLIGVNWGLIGVSLAWLFVFPLIVYIRLRRSLPVLGIPVKQYFSSVSGPVMGAAVMYAAVNLMHFLVAVPYLPSTIGLPILVLTGVVSYAGFMWLFKRDECFQILDLVRKRNGSAPGPEMSVEEGG